MKRSSGILMHITSLPSPYGIGDLGSESFRFVDFLKSSGQKIWQILPLTIPDGYGSSYASSSAFAANWLLISPDDLVVENLLDKNSLPRKKRVSGVKFRSIIRERKKLLNSSYRFFIKHASIEQKRYFRNFKADNSTWLDDYALFMALKDHFKRKPWYRWPKNIANREKKSVRYWRGRLKNQIDVYRYGQWVFFAQYSKLKNYANKKGIKIFGDIPFFVKYDSVDVWAERDIFLLDENNKPLAKSGVPPDYFSRSGQLWGDPQYDWHKMRKDSFRWFMARMQMASNLYDIIRLDHFRGYEAVWHVDKKSKTSKNGKWVKVPGKQLFQKVKKRFKNLTIIAEDLGYITDEVIELKNILKFPGMRVIQFGFGGKSDNYHLPKNFPKDCVAYTGTHDNDTSRGWIKKSGKSEQKKFALKYTKSTKKNFAWKIIERGAKSRADWFIFPMQDALNLDSRARMNTPATKKKNWKWRMRPYALTEDLALKICKLTKSTKR